MASVLAAGLGLVAGVFLLIVAGEAYYLFYWRKRPRTFPRGGVTVAPVTEAEAEAVGGGSSGGVVIDVTCAEYQIAALHQDLVEKLFPAAGGGWGGAGGGGGSAEESPQNLMGPTRMLFTITEETKEELEGLDVDGKGTRMRSRRSSRSESMSDISLSPGDPLSPVDPLSPGSTPFGTPFSSPDICPGSRYGTPTGDSPMGPQPRSLSASPPVFKTSCRIMEDYTSSSPPPGPPSPTRPSSPFLARAASPGKSPDYLRSMSPTMREMVASSPNRTVAAPFYSPPRKPFSLGSSPIRRQADGLAGGGKAASPLRACTYVYDNGTFSPSSPSSPRGFPPSPMAKPLADLACHEIWQDHHRNESVSPFASPHSSCSSAGSSVLIPLSSRYSPHSDSAGQSASPRSSCSSPGYSKCSPAVLSNARHSSSVPADPAAPADSVRGNGSLSPKKRKEACLPPSGWDASALIQ